MNAVAILEIVVHEPTPHWQVRCLEHLAAIEGAALRIVTRRPRPSPLWSLVSMWSPMLRRASRPRLAAPIGRHQLRLDLTGEEAPGPSGWRLVQGDGRGLAAAFPFAAEWSRPDTVGQAMLVDEDDRVLRSASLSINRGFYTHAVGELLRVAAMLPAQAWQDRLHGVSLCHTRAASRATPPGNGLAGGLALYALRRLHEIPRLDYWQVGVVDEPIHHFLAPVPHPRPRWLTVPDADGYCADPFAHPDKPEEVWWERYDYRSGRGHIERQRGGGASPERVALGSGHSSFPFLGRFGEDVVLIPEMGDTGSTRLYRLDEQGEPRLIAVLPVPGIDPVMFAWDNRCWLGLTRPDIDGRANFCLWYATSPVGPWTPHAGNPVKIDIRSGRCAGTPFWHDGQLYRPAQDCSATYGGAVAINRVIDCSPTRYHEELVSVVRPEQCGPDFHGVHTLSRCGQRTLIDAKRSMLSTVTFGARLRRALWRPARKAALSPGTGSACLVDAAGVDGESQGQ